ncbi:MAG: outer membrane protein assembly factor BamA [Puniceicoccales bacterium]|jgi:outer membrane protein insertion porin family|nr:outer membrane protein assembly factor BamA [Puniceicoccales bacterium]
MPKKIIRSLCVAWFFSFHVLVFADGDPDSLEDLDSTAQPLMSVYSSAVDDETNYDLEDSFEDVDFVAQPLMPTYSSAVDNETIYDQEPMLPSNKETLPDDSDIKKESEPDSLPPSATTFSSYAKTSEQGPFLIRKIFITVDGNVPANEDFIRSRMKLSEEESFNPYVADEAMHSLFATNIFEDIHISADQNRDGTLDVHLMLTSRPKIAAIEYPHEKTSNKKLKKELKTVSGEYLNKAFINDDIQTIYRYYQTQGFPKPTINYEIIPTDDPKYVKVVFDIVPGEGLHISKINFINFIDVDTEKIRKRMVLKTWSIFSFITKKGCFVDVLLDVDRTMITEEMQNAGYLDAKIVRAEFVNANNKTNGILEFVADLGQKYFIGNVHFEGNNIYSNDQIASLIKIKTGDPFSPGNIDGVAETIRNFYSYHGYINSFVKIEKIPTFVNNTIDVKFIINESSLTYVNSILIKGNFKTKNKVILRELALAPGEKFNYIKMKNSENRLKNTGFFETVSLDVRDSDTPDYKDIQVDIKEKNTGKIQVGGAISAKNNQFVFLELSQSNFDLFNSRAKFQGSGQKARTRVQIGTRSNQLILSFEEPYLFDRELAFGTDLVGEKTKYRESDSNYSGATYDRTSLGMEPYFRKRLYELWVGRLAYNITGGNIRNVADNAPKPLKDEKGHFTDSRIKFSIERDTRDNYIFPRTGSLLDIDTQIAGIGGTRKLFKTAASATKWFTISEKYDHTLALAFRIGTICPFSGKTTPYTERYFLGGDTLMRGFEDREISPKEKKVNAVTYESVGGNSFVYGGAEYTFNIFDDFYGAVFLEVGNVGIHQSPFRHGFNVDAGFGLRIFIGGMPLHLDWGYPIHCTKGVQKDGIQFNFSFGTSF